MGTRWIVTSKKIFCMMRVRSTMYAMRRRSASWLKRCSAQYVKQCGNTYMLVIAERRRHLARDERGVGVSDWSSRATEGEKRSRYCTRMNMRKRTDSQGGVRKIQWVEALC